MPHISSNLRFAPILLTVLAGLSLAPHKESRAALIINEFAASNSEGITDEDGDYSDWIEIYNNGENTAPLDRWSLTDEADFPHKWPFPDLSLAPGEYLLIFASGKDRATADGQLHTNFELDKSGEYLALCYNGVPQPNSEFEPQYPRQVTNYSYGAKTGESHFWFFETPTPGEANTGANYPGITPQPAFSHQRGFYDSPFKVLLSTSLPDAEIYYATNGSAPTQTTGQLYTNPITIEHTTILRAAVFKPGYLTAPPKTDSYIFLEDVYDQPQYPDGFPTVWHPGYPVNYQMHPDVVEEYRVELDEAFTSIPSISIVMDMEDLFDQETGIYPNSEERGVEWERPASVELFYSDGREGFDVNCGIRIYGDGSAIPEVNLKHTFRLLFKGDYGPSKLSYPLFENSPVSEFDTIILRGSSNFSWAHRMDDMEWQREDALYIRDVWARDTQIAMGQPGSYSTYVHLYLNGLYWGLYNPSERPNASFLASHIGGRKDEWDVLNAGVVVGGDRRAWNIAMDIANSGLETADAYEAIQQYVDIDNLIDYIILQHFIQNLDWGGSNWYAGRRRQTGAGYKFFIWDAEFSVYDYFINTTTMNLAGTPQRLFSELRKNVEFRLRVADRLHKHLFNGGVLTTESAVERWMARADEINPAIIAESARWGDNWMRLHNNEPYTRDGDWLPALNWVINQFLPRRPEILLQQYREIDLYPHVEAPAFYVNGSYQHGGEVDRGDRIAIQNRNGAGIVFYTLDGSDPRKPGSPGEIVEQVKLIRESASKAVLVPTAENPGGSEWRIYLNYPDSSWTDYSRLPGHAGGVGYEREEVFRDYISYDVEDKMYGRATSCYIRILFDVPAGSLEGFNSLKLRIRYDDGFAAYLNGAKIADANAPALLRYNSSATESERESADFQEFDVTAFVSQIADGDNLLAIHGLNIEDGSSDFLISVELVAERLEGGSPAGISDSALLFNKPFNLAESATAKTRTLHNGEWSALTEATFLVPQRTLVITEMMYHPQDGGAEFIELRNMTPQTMDLSGTFFNDGIEFTFPPGAMLAAGEHIILVHDRDLIVFQALYPDLPVGGTYSSALSNAGELVSITEPQFAQVLCAVEYSDTAPWPVEADGGGYSLEIIDIYGDYNDPTNWRASRFLGGTPGQSPSYTTGIRPPHWRLYR